MTHGDDERLPKLTPALIEELKKKVNPQTEKPYTQSEIAAMWGVTRQHVSWVKHQTDRYTKTPREVALESYPWTHAHWRHGQSAPSQRLRDHAEYMATGGKGMSDEKLRRLGWFYRRLIDENLVVEYDPDIPPNEENTFGGYTYRPRRPEDGELIIRVNGHATMTPQAEVIWRLPKTLPTGE